METTRTVSVARAKETTANKVAIAESKLSSIYAAAFSTTSGMEVLKHLKHELMSVESPNTSKLRLVHREGGRFVIKSIINRIEEGKKNV